MRAVNRSIAACILGLVAASPAHADVVIRQTYSTPADNPPTTGYVLRIEPLCADRRDSPVLGLSLRCDGRGPVVVRLNRRILRAFPSPRRTSGSGRGATSCRLDGWHRPAFRRRIGAGHFAPRTSVARARSNQSSERGIRTGLAHKQTSPKAVFFWTQALRGCTLDLPGT